MSTELKNKYICGNCHKDVTNLVDVENKQYGGCLHCGAMSLVDYSYGPAPSEENLEIVPFGLEGSVIPGVKPDRSNRWRPTLFIGGPLDGQHIRVPNDGRLYDLPLQAVQDENGDIDIDIGLRRYVPSFITFDGRRMMVYIYLNHLREYHFKCVEAERKRHEALPVDQAPERQLIEASKKRLGISQEQ